MPPNRFQILLIEDSPAEAKLFEEALAQAAPRVKLYWVGSTQEGLQYLRREDRFHDMGPVNLVVCDLNLPGKNGFDFLADVKRDSTLRRTPLVVYSGSSAPRDIDVCYSLGANSYVIKPMTLDTMIQQLKGLVHYWLELAALPDQILID